MARQYLTADTGGKLGDADGLALGLAEGDLDGLAEAEGDSEGLALGLLEGEELGEAEGLADADGDSEGLAEGLLEGLAEGLGLAAIDDCTSKHTGMDSS